MIDDATADRWAQDLRAACQSNAPKPTGGQAGWLAADAYRVQRRLIALYNDVIVGFKAGLTNASVQQRQGADKPAGGVLLSEAGADPGVVFSLRRFVRPRIETEIGFVLGSDIMQPVTPEEVKDYLSYWFPMIELVDIGFASPHVVTDLIASNVIAARYIRSDFVNDPIHSNQAIVSLYRNGERLHEGKGTDVLGDQFTAAAWIVNYALEQGYSLKAGHVLMTGALGTTHPAEVASYRADYGEFGAVEFSFDP